MDESIHQSYYSFRRFRNIGQSDTNQLYWFVLTVLEVSLLGQATVRVNHLLGALRQLGFTTLNKVANTESEHVRTHLLGVAILFPRLFTTWIY